MNIQWNITSVAIWFQQIDHVNSFTKWLFKMSFKSIIFWTRPTWNHRTLFLFLHCVYFDYFICLMFLSLFLYIFLFSLNWKHFFNKHLFIFLKKMFKKERERGRKSVIVDIMTTLFTSYFGAWILIWFFFYLYFWAVDLVLDVITVSCVILHNLLIFNFNDTALFNFIMWKLIIN